MVLVLKGQHRHWSRLPHTLATNPEAQEACHGNVPAFNPAPALRLSAVLIAVQCVNSHGCTETQPGCSPRGTLHMGRMTSLQAWKPSVELSSTSWGGKSAAPVLTSHFNPSCSRPMRARGSACHIEAKAGLEVRASPIPSASFPPWNAASCAEHLLPQFPHLINELSP